MQCQVLLGLASSKNGLALLLACTGLLRLHMSCQHAVFVSRQFRGTASCLTGVRSSCCVGLFAARAAIDSFHAFYEYFR